MIDIRRWLFGDRGKAFEEAEHSEAKALLAPFAERIAATKLPVVAISLSDDLPAHAAASQLGGLPWWPANISYPCHKESRAPLFLLAQINFADTPKLDPFPERGLLQFFIAASDLYGCDFDNPQNGPGFACIYHEDVSGARLTDLSFLKLEAGDYLPLEAPLKPLPMSFSQASMTIDPSDYRFDMLLPEIAGDDDLREAYFELQKTPALRLGGYPTFTQTDPRFYGNASKYGDFTLFTADTTDGIMWGDSGVAQFFMNEKDLSRRDFSRVAYNWDCC